MDEKIFTYLFWFLVVLFWTIAVTNRVNSKKNKIMRVLEAEIEWLKLRAEFLAYPEDIDKKSKEEMVDCFPHMQLIYANYSKEEVIEDIKKEV